MLEIDGSGLPFLETEVCPARHRAIHVYDVDDATQTAKHCCRCLMLHCITCCAHSNVVVHIVETLTDNCLICNQEQASIIAGLPNSLFSRALAAEPSV